MKLTGLQIPLQSLNKFSGNHFCQQKILLESQRHMYMKNIMENTLFVRNDGKY